MLLFTQGCYLFSADASVLPKLAFRIIYELMQHHSAHLAAQTGPLKLINVTVNQSQLTHHATIFQHFPMSHIFLAFFL